MRTTLGGDLDFSITVKNLGDKDVQGQIQCALYSPTGHELFRPRAPFDVKGKVSDLVALHIRIPNPEIWYPSQWGDQPLYSVQCTATTEPLTNVSIAYDQTPKTRFGIRTVISKLNEHNDTTFSINGNSFQVLGGGYTSDIFLRFDIDKLRAQFQYVLDMGLNTIRLEGKQEHPELYDLADEMGIMLLPGWECCDKWEGWEYNDEGSGEKWDDEDYATAATSMAHEVGMMQNHPSVMGFLIGSDFWPDNRATHLYVNTLMDYNWTTPIISSASQRGSPSGLGNGGMKMAGPYDWVPPNYWYDTLNGSDTRLGAAFGFGSELGAGVGTPEYNSLRKFLSPSDIDDLWKNPNKGLYHMSTNVSSFYTRSIYNTALWSRYGVPKDLDDYLLKAQMADYEATRAQFEAYLSRWSASRPATGLIYWMLNNAWPSLHWNLFDYYLHPGGSYFGTKAALANMETAIFDYHARDVYLVNRHLNLPTLDSQRTITIDIITLNGTIISSDKSTVLTTPNTSKRLTHISALSSISEPILLRLTLTPSNPDPSNPSSILSRTTYWLPSTPDVLSWPNSTWYHTPVLSFSNLTALSHMREAHIVVRGTGTSITLENTSDVPAVFVSLNLMDEWGRDVVPVVWETNYLTLWPRESVDVAVTYGSTYGSAGEEWDVDGLRVRIQGRNVRARTVRLNGGTQVLGGEGF